MRILTILIRVIISPSTKARHLDKARPRGRAERFPRTGSGCQSVRRGERRKTRGVGGGKAEASPRPSGTKSKGEDREGGTINRWQRERCGKSEEVHRILKEDLAGGHVISHRFGANAFWWNVAVLSLSVHSLAKRLLLPGKVRSCRPKTLRFLFYTSIGRMVRHARRVVLLNSFFALLMPFLRICGPSDALTTLYFPL